jgi:hypothetical protein
MLKSLQLMEKCMMMGMTKRIQVTLPNRLAEDLQKWADYDGRPLSNLAAYLLERAVNEAKAEDAEWAKETPSPAKKGKGD